MSVVVLTQRGLEKYRKELSPNYTKLTFSTHGSGLVIRKGGSEKLAIKKILRIILNEYCFVLIRYA